MNNNLIRILIASFLILVGFCTNTYAAGSAAITITVTLAEVEIIEATVEFQPEIIRPPGSRYLRCYIELPAPYKVEDIDVASVALTEVNGTTIDPPLETMGRPRIGDFDRDGIRDLIVQFDLRDLTPFLRVGENTLTVTGNIVDGKKFKGRGTIRLIPPGRR